MLYQMNEGTLTLPDNWTDESLHVLKAPAEEGINVVVSRGKIPPHQSQAQYLQEQKQAIKNNLNAYQEISSSTVTIDGIPCPLLHYQWQSQEGDMYQMNVLWARNNDLLSFTVTSQKPFTPSQQAACVTLVASFKPQPVV